MMADSLLRWYDQYGRDLPWRHTRNPYKILVSEIMLQQTQVPRVLLFYRRWLKKFPDWNSLARTPNATVIKEWSGLGYNRRALALRDIAKQISKIPNGQMSKVEWDKLKGIGPYTAAAIAVFAFHERVLPIDTNIRRVLGRVLLGHPFPQPIDDDRIRFRAARSLLRIQRHYDIPQALFDLATTICTKRPTCLTCPLKKECLASKKFLSGRVRVPKQMIKKAQETRHRNKPYPDRIYRGRILRLVQNDSSISVDDLGPSIDPTFDFAHDALWLQAIISRLIKEKFIKQRQGRLFLHGRG